MGGGSGQSGLESSINTQNNVSLVVGSGMGGDSSFTPKTEQTQTQKATTDAGIGASVGLGFGGSGSAGAVSGNGGTSGGTSSGVMNLINPTNIAIGVAVYLLAKKL